MEILRSLPSLNINVSKKPHLNGESTQMVFRQDKKATSSAGQASSLDTSLQDRQPSRTEVLISVSSEGLPSGQTVAEACAENGLPSGQNGIDLSGQRLSFSVDEETGTTVINIIDNETDEVVRQIPPDDILHLKKRMGEIQGLLLDRKV